jgi:archaeosine synthase beta-subunit
MTHPIPGFTDGQILAARPPRNAVDPRRPYAFLVEPERNARGEVVDVATLFLTNRECPFRCLMCDLWKNTLTEPVAVGDIPEQIRWGLAQVGPDRRSGPLTPVGSEQTERPNEANRAIKVRTGRPDLREIKLYNSGNFFDRKAIPPEDYAEIAELVRGFDTVIVENHPNLCDAACVRFRDLIAPAKLEIALGLETVQPEVLPALNKRMTLDDFRRAVEFLLNADIAVRAFVLLRPPFLEEAEGVEWAVRSLEFAFSLGVDCCSVIPTRAGNGIMEQLQRDGLFAPPRLRSAECVLETGIRWCTDFSRPIARGSDDIPTPGRLKSGHQRVFLDLWDLESLAECPKCGLARIERLRRMNLSQELLPRVVCDCEAPS